MIETQVWATARIASATTEVQTADIIRAAIALAVLTHLIDTDDNMVLITPWITDTTRTLMTEMQTWTTARNTSVATQAQTADTIRAAMALAVLTYLIHTDDDMLLITPWIADATITLMAEMQTWTTARIASATQVRTADIIRAAMALVVLTHLTDTDDDMVPITLWIADTTGTLMIEIQRWATDLIASAAQVRTADTIHLVLSDGS